jgi:RNA polymerase sigma-70 factor (ECF subfamily)
MTGNNKELSDDVLILKTSAGDRAAFGELMDRHSSAIYNFLNRILNDPAASEDLCQDVFLSVYKSASRWRPRAKVKTWIFRIARNAALNELNTARRKFDTKNKPAFNVNNCSSSVETFPSSGPDPEAALLKSEQTVMVSAALEKLPENQRTAIMLKRFEDFSYKEIAEVMQTTVSAVESLIFRARQNLKKSLRKYNT